MKSKIFKKAVLLTTSLVVVGIAHAAYSSYQEATDAARLQFSQKNYAEAQKSVEESLTFAKTQEEKVGSLIRLGRILNERKLYDQAREKWTSVLKMTDASKANQIAAQVAIATSYGQEKNWESSRAEFQKLLENPATSASEKATFRLSIAATYTAQGDDVNAQKTLSAIVQDTTQESALRTAASLQLGQSFVDAKNYGEARTAFSKVLELTNNPGFRVAARAAIADSYKAQSDANQLQQAYNDAIVEAVTQAKVLNDNKQYASARAMQEQALTFGPLSPTMDMTLRVQIAQTLLLEGKPAEARAALEAFLARKYAEPTTPKERADFNLLRQAAQLNIAKSYAQEGDKVQAQKLLDDLLQEKPLSPGIPAGVEEVRQLMH